MPCKWVCTNGFLRQISHQHIGFPALQSSFPHMAIECLKIVRQPFSTIQIKYLYHVKLFTIIKLHNVHVHKRTPVFCVTCTWGQKVCVELVHRTLSKHYLFISLYIQIKTQIFILISDNNTKMFPLNCQRTHISHTSHARCVKYNKSMNSQYGKQLWWAVADWIFGIYVYTISYINFLLFFCYFYFQIFIHWTQLTVYNACHKAKCHVTYKQMMRNNFNSNEQGWKERERASERAIACGIQTGKYNK